MKYKHPIILIILTIIILNILLSGFHIMPIERPYFYYEYLAVPLLFCYISNKWMQMLILGLIIFADAVISLSHLYFFDPVNYIRKFPSLFYTHFPWYFWTLVIVCLIIFIVGLYFYVNSYYLKQIGKSKSDKKTYGIFLIISFCFLYFFDSVFGFSILNFKPPRNIRINIGKSIIRDYYNNMALYLKSYETVSHFDDFKNMNGNNKSIGYQYLYNDSSAHQILIILESWGLLKDTSLRNQQIRSILELKEKGYSVQFDTSNFFGGTSQAEARELLNKEGEAYYSIIQNGQLDIECLPSHKNKTGYYTTALQSFSGFHSSGNQFRTILGFKAIKDYSNFKNSKKINENYNNHYNAVNDEAVFDFGFKLITAHPKTFTYILTINTHLPFESKLTSKSNFPSIETKGQYKRLEEQFEHLAYLLKEFPEAMLVIVGDHPPPFLLQSERDLYDENLVPALIVSCKRIP